MYVWSIVHCYSNTMPVIIQRTELDGTERTELNDSFLQGIIIYSFAGVLPADEISLYNKLVRKSA